MVGPIIVAKAGMARADGSPRDVEVIPAWSHEALFPVPLTAALWLPKIGGVELEVIT